MKLSRAQAVLSREWKEWRDLRRFGPCVCVSEFRYDVLEKVKNIPLEHARTDCGYEQWYMREGTSR